MTAHQLSARSSFHNSLFSAKFPHEDHSPILLRLALCRFRQSRQEYSCSRAQNVSHKMDGGLLAGVATAFKSHLNMVDISVASGLPGHVYRAILDASLKVRVM
jgi:hypothetical protein